MITLKPKQNVIADLVASNESTLIFVADAAEGRFKAIGKGFGNQLIYDVAECNGLEVFDLGGFLHFQDEGVKRVVP